MWEEGVPVCETVRLSSVSHSVCHHSVCTCMLLLLLGNGKNIRLSPPLNHPYVVFTTYLLCVAIVMCIV